MKHYHCLFVMYAMLKPEGERSCKNAARSFPLYVEDPWREKISDMDNKLLVILASKKLQ